MTWELEMKNSICFERKNANENTKFLLSNLPFNAFVHDLFTREITVKRA